MSWLVKLDPQIFAMSKICQSKLKFGMVLPQIRAIFVKVIVFGMLLINGLFNSKFK
jgi:hypothetical protein